MKISRSLLCLGFLLAGSVRPVAANTQPQPGSLARRPAGELSADQIALQGLTSMGGELYAALALPSMPGVWKKAGDRIGRFKVAAVDEQSVSLMDPAAGSAQVLELGRRPATGQAPAKFSKAWINSKANPMLHHPTALPAEIVTKWPKLTEPQQAEVIACYRQHGWQLLHAETRAGLTAGFSWKNLYEQARREVLAAANAAFEASLSAEQRAGWNDIKSPPPLHLGPQGQTQEMKDEVVRRQARSLQFRKTLTPEQLEAYRNRSDFTRHDWSGE